MRAVALHRDVLVFTSDVWQTNCTAVRCGDEGFVIDSPVYPEELRVLPEMLEQAGFPVSGLLVTHGDWDHLLCRTVFGQAALAAGESTVERLGSDLGQAHRALREFDSEHYVQRGSPLALGSLQSLPVPGRLELGSTSGDDAAPGDSGGRELELHPADGHTADGTAFWLGWVRVLVCGDYLSPVELPMISQGGSVDRYLATLQRLRGLVDQAEWIVPGHGSPLSSARAAEILAEDQAYLTALANDPATAALPPRIGPNASASQRRIHDANVATR